MARISPIVASVALVSLAAASFWLGRYSMSHGDGEPLGDMAFRPSGERDLVAGVKSLIAQETQRLEAAEGMAPMEQSPYATDQTWGAVFSSMQPEEAPYILSELMAMNDGKGRPGLLKRFFASWGALDGVAAFEGAKEMSGRNRPDFMSAAAGGWAKNDPIGAWEALMVASNRGAISSFSLFPVMQEVVGRDLSLAGSLVDQAGSEAARDSYLRALLGEAREDGDYGRALRALGASVSMQDDPEYVAKIFQGWGRDDLEGAMAALQRLDSESSLEAAMVGAMRGWASTDALGAFDYVLANGDDPLVARSLKSVANILARSSTAEEITALFTSVSDEEQKAQMAAAVMPHLAKADADFALNWALSLESKRVRSQSIQEVVRVMAAADYSQVRALVAGGKLDAEAQKSAFDAVSSLARNGKQEILEAVDLASALDEETRSYAVARLAALAAPRKAGVTQFGSKTVNRAYLTDAVLASPDFSDAEKEVFVKRSSGKRKANAEKP